MMDDTSLPPQRSLVSTGVETKAATTPIIQTTTTPGLVDLVPGTEGHTTTGLTQRNVITGSLVPLTADTDEMTPMMKDVADRPVTEGHVRGQGTTVHEMYRTAARTARRRRKRRRDTDIVTHRPGTSITVAAANQRVAGEEKGTMISVEGAKEAVTPPLKNLLRWRRRRLYQLDSNPKERLVKTWMREACLLLNSR